MAFAPSSLILANYILPVNRALCVKEIPLNWYEPKGYSAWKYNRKAHKSKGPLIFLSIIGVTLCVSSYTMLTPEFRYENYLEEFELYVFASSLSFLFFHFVYWLNSKFNFIRKKIELSNTCVYLGGRGEFQTSQPDIYFNDIKSFEIELVAWKNLEFYSVRCLSSIKAIKK